MQNSPGQHSTNKDNNRFTQNTQSGAKKQILTKPNTSNGQPKYGQFSLTSVTKDFADCSSFRPQTEEHAFWRLWTNIQKDASSRTKPVLIEPLTSSWLPR